MRNVQAAHSCSTGINWGASPAAAAIPSAHPAEEQEAWLSLVMMRTEGACIPPADVAGAEKGPSVDLWGALLEDPTAGAFLFFSAL